MKKRGRNTIRRKQTRRRWVIGGVAALVLLVAAVILIDAARTPKVEGVQELPNEGNRHLEADPGVYIWQSNPPTSGPHAPQIASWGEHDTTVPEWYQVHNLEDGGVIIHYNCPDGCPETITELRAILDEMGANQLILHPYTNMDSRIALTAWTRLLTLDTVDRTRIIDFIKAYRGIDHHL